MEKLNIILLGGGAVGKSSIVKQCCFHQFDDEYDPTLENEYDLEMTVDGKEYNIHIVDTAGQEEYKDLRDRSIKEGDGFVMVFSLVDDVSFKELETLHEHIVRALGLDRDEYVIPMVLVGNKTGLSYQRVVEKERAELLAKEWESKYYEISAKNNSCIQDIFTFIIRHIKTHKPIRARECRVPCRHH